MGLLEFSVLWNILGLPSSGSWQDLKDHMREAGDVCFADSFKDGSGVVEFLRFEDMKYAIKKLDDSRFRSHEVSIWIYNCEEALQNNIYREKYPIFEWKKIKEATTEDLVVDREAGLIPLKDVDLLRIHLWNVATQGAGLALEPWNSKFQLRKNILRSFSVYVFLCHFIKFEFK